MAYFLKDDNFIIERLKEVASTNIYTEKKYLKKRTPAIVRADRQTCGMGTKGRSFISDEGGLYLTRLDFYSCLPTSESFEIMINYAVGTVKTLKAFGVESYIKWPNDILVGGKKICGILIKNGFCGDFVDYSLVGLGLNVNNDIAAEISGIATSMKQAAGKSFDIDSVFFTLMKNVAEGSTIEEYRACSGVIGKRVKIIRSDRVYEEVAVAVNDDGRLVLSDGEILSAAELDLRIGL